MLSLLMVFLGESLAFQEKAYLTLSKEIKSQASFVRDQLILMENIADCKGGDNEMKPYHVPVDFYTSGVACG